MTIIYKNPTAKRHHDQVIPETGTPPTIKIYVDVQPSYFEIKMSYDTVNIFDITIDDQEPETRTETKTHYLLWHKLPLTALQGNTGFSDQSLWAIADNVKLETGERNKFDQNGDPEAWVISSNELVDAFANTVATKPSVSYTDSSPAYDTTYDVFVPFLNGLDMTKCEYRLYLDQNLTYEIDPTSPAAADIVDVSGRVKEMIAPITVTGPSTIDADSTITVDVTTIPGIYAVYLEQVYGILPKTKVLIDAAGNGSFKVLTSGMDVGDTVEVKVGFKKWVNRATYSKTIS
jgi:hypothetical protein